MTRGDLLGVLEGLDCKSKILRDKKSGSLKVSVCKVWLGASRLPPQSLDVQSLDFIQIPHFNQAIQLAYAASWILKSSFDKIPESNCDSPN